MEGATSLKVLILVEVLASLVSGWQVEVVMSIMTLSVVCVATNLTCCFLLLAWEEKIMEEEESAAVAGQDVVLAGQELGHSCARQSYPPAPLRRF